MLWHHVSKNISEQNPLGMIPCLQAIHSIYHIIIGYDTMLTSYSLNIQHHHWVWYHVHKLFTQYTMSSLGMIPCLQAISLNIPCHHWVWYHVDKLFHWIYHVIIGYDTMFTSYFTQYTMSSLAMIPCLQAISLNIPCYHWHTPIMNVPC